MSFIRTRTLIPAQGLALLTTGWMTLTAWAFEPVRSFVVTDLHSGTVLMGKQAEMKVQVASLTKIATACVVLDWMEASKTDVNEMMTVPDTVLGIGGANPLGLAPGDLLSVRDGLYLALIGSDNVAAETLAYHVGKDLLRRRGKPGRPVEVFVAQMNTLSKQQGLKRTRFRNPHGLDHRVRPFSTAHDMATLTAYALSKASFRFYVSQKSRNVSYKRGDQRFGFEVKNTNVLLGVNDIDGVKTGMTSAAGACVILSAARPTTVLTGPGGEKLLQPHRLIVVVLGAGDRFDSGRQLLAAGWQRYDAWLAGRDDPASQPAATR
ncbi:MAG TPA: serine hydrolase [Verrucomicrobiales bacterium]|nr:serine hydrolase [Verrucomicrobiales bacterium]